MLPHPLTKKKPLQTRRPGQPRASGVLPELGSSQVFLYENVTSSLSKVALYVMCMQPAWSRGEETPSEEQGPKHGGRSTGKLA